MPRRLLALVLAIFAVILIPGVGAAAAPQPTIEVVEYYHAGLDHYFITGSAQEQAQLDNGTLQGWRRTGQSFGALAPNGILPGARPVCRFYGLPSAGINSHFYSAIGEECAALGALRAREWMLEASNVFQVRLPDTTTGACAADGVPVYRLFNQRHDVNHRYTTDPVIRDQMKALRYVAEGYGPEGVAFCALSKEATQAGGAAGTFAVTIRANRIDGETFAFNAAVDSPNALASHAWTFGDGASSTAATPTHKYPAPGTFNVQVTVTDSRGNRGASTTTVEVQSGMAAPVPQIVVSSTAADTFSFSSTVTTAAGASVTSHAWSFGDGATASGATATHKYQASGTYTVTLTVQDSNNLTGSATASVNATVGAAPPPPPPTPPPTLPPAGALGDRVRASFANSSHIYASNPLGDSAPWRNRGGDWLDRNGALNGPTPTIAHVVTSANLAIDISNVDGDLLLQGIDGWDNPKIDGLDAEAFWTDASSNRAQGMPAKWGRPGVVLNAAGGKTLTLVANAQSIGRTLRIDRLAGPVVDDRPTYVGPSNRPDIVDLDLGSEAALLAVIGQNYAGQYAFEPEFKVDPQTGLKYLRFASDVAFQKLIAWFINFPGRESAHARYLIYIEDDVADGMTELGMKLPGLANHTGELISWRMEHGRVDPRNRGAYSFVDYLYNAESGPGYGLVRSMGGTVLRAGRWYSIEQKMVLNTPGVGNGYGEIWLNGQSVWRSNTVRWRDQAATRITQMHVNVYHGGMGLPSRPFHYRIAKIGIGTSYIGVPSELLATASPPPVASLNTAYPAWRATMTKDRVGAIANTANMNGVTALGNGTRQGYNTIDAWNGLAAGPTSWWAAANGGHDQGNGILWENKVYKIDLAAAAPRWTLVHPGSPWSQVTPNGHHYLDGLPVSRHTYYSAQYIPSKNRVMLFGAAAPYAIGFAPPAFQGGPIVDGFDIRTGKWDAANTWATAPASAFQIAAGVARDPRNDEVYMTGRSGFAKWSPIANAWTKITPKRPDGSATTAPSGEFKPTLIDVKRNQWVFYSAQQIRAIDLATHVYTVRGNVTGAITSGAEDYSALVHDLDNDRYLTIQGTGLYAIDPDTLASTLIATVPRAVNGTQNRFAYFPELGGVAYLPHFASDVLFMPTR